MFNIRVVARPREFNTERALQQAMRVFWHQGYQGTSIEDLMKAAKVQKQSLYCAFGDKRSLFLHSLRLYRAQILAEIQGLLSNSTSPLEGIQRVMQYASQPPTGKNCPSGCLMANTALEIGLSDPEIADEVRRTLRAFERVLEVAVKKGQQEREITSRFDSAAIAQTLVNTINGIRVLEKTGASNKEMKSVAETVLASIRN